MVKEKHLDGVCYAHLMTPQQPGWRKPSRSQGSLTDAETYIAQTRRWPGASAEPWNVGFYAAQQMYESVPEKHGMTFQSWWHQHGESMYDEYMSAALRSARLWKESGAPRSKGPGFGPFWYWVALRQQIDC